MAWPPSRASISGVVANSGLFTVATVLSGTLFPASGATQIASGPFVVATASVASGSLYLASGSVFRETFASGVLAASGGLTTAWGNSGQAFAASGSFAVVPPATLSGVVANSGLTVTVIKANLSGIVANSGLTVTVVNASLSGTFVAAGLLSGQSVNVYSGQLSGQNMDVLSGTLFPASGVNTVVPPITLSGVVANSGLTVNVIKETISGVVGASGLFTLVPKETLSGVVANSGLFVVATASVASGSLYIASGSLFRESFASGVFQASGGFPTAWGDSGLVKTVSGTTWIASGPNVAETLSGTLYPASGINVTVPIASISGAIGNSGQFVTAGVLSGQNVTLYSGTVAEVARVTLTISAGVSSVVVDLRARKAYQSAPPGRAPMPAVSRAAGR